MFSRRLVVATVVGAFLALDAGAVAYAEPAPGSPTGSFTIRHPTQYISSVEEYRASVVVERLALADDATPTKDLVVTLYGDEGAAGTRWSGTAAEQRIRYDGGPDDTWSVIQGAHHPYVTVTDGDGHTTRIDLPTVTLLRDSTPPVTRLTKPKPRRRHTIRGWRFIHGTTVDAGIDGRGSDTGWGTTTFVILTQKRHGRWYLYNAVTKKWRRGLRTEAATLRKFHPVGDVARNTNATHWRTRYVRGLTRGRLVVRTWAMDSNANTSRTKVVARYTLTRRR